MWPRYSTTHVPFHTLVVDFQEHGCDDLFFDQRDLKSGEWHWFGVRQHDHYGHHHRTSTFVTGKDQLTIQHDLTEILTSGGTGVLALKDGDVLVLPGTTTTKTVSNQRTSGLTGITGGSGGTGGPSGGGSL